ncbi:MAG: hypothetical protein Q8S27_01010 [Hoeflea sp.]|nr:hypothetical protein [Hoeflea sp.]
MSERVSADALEAVANPAQVANSASKQNRNIKDTTAIPRPSRTLAAACLGECSKSEPGVIIAKIVPERRKTVVNHYLVINCGDTMATAAMYRFGIPYSERSLNKE